MGNTSTYNREYYLKNKERISEMQKMRIKNMTAEEREAYLNRMRDWYRNRKGRFISKSKLREENKKLKAERLQREREANKPFRVFSTTDDGVYIAEGIGKELKVIRGFKFKGYDMYHNAIFSFKEEFIPVK